MLESAIATAGYEEGDASQDRHDGTCAGPPHERPETKATQEQNEGHDECRKACDDARYVQCGRVLHGPRVTDDTPVQQGQAARKGGDPDAPDDESRVVARQVEQA